MLFHRSGLSATLTYSRTTLYRKGIDMPLIEMIALVMGGFALAVIIMCLLGVILMIADDKYDEHEDINNSRG